ncbi:hypothetical protein [Bradyrhizobium liaoningense]|uniref:hypothetical protein n=1 Tax=Bradyrhizobium liaoningense TaxID=43992 RepID=UPI001BA51B5C|nr:hypothetical protein [Bradyrhizobium liaoningense]MBR0822035.1 hypothetical protein [Bradyrhizobium liaoningense]
MANSFLIGMSTWLGINILFMVARLWVTQPKDWQINASPRQLSTVRVKSRLYRHV